MADDAFDEGMLRWFAWLDEGSVTVRSRAHKNIGLLVRVSFGLLSQTKEAGSERCCAIPSRNLAKRHPGTDVSTNWQAHSRLKSSTMSARVNGTPKPADRKRTPSSSAAWSCPDMPSSLLAAPAVCAGSFG